MAINALLVLKSKRGKANQASLLITVLAIFRTFKTFLKFWVIIVMRMALLDHKLIRSVIIFTRN
jgi:hypothetical protein